MEKQDLLVQIALSQKERYEAKRYENRMRLYESSHRIVARNLDKRYDIDPD